MSVAGHNERRIVTDRRPPRVAAGVGKAACVFPLRHVADAKAQATAASAA